MGRRFLLAVSRGTLTRAAAIAIAQSETGGTRPCRMRSLCRASDGLTEREGIRRCPLDSYRGRGSLLGWLRTTLAQRHVDHYRRTNREQLLDARSDTHGCRRRTRFPAPSIARTLT